MDDGDLLREQMKVNPTDSTIQLVYADWLDEQGLATQAALRRVIAELENDDWRLQYASLLERETPQWVTCPECKGKCKVFLHAAGAGGVWRTCDRCNGTGEVIDTNRTDRAAFIRCQIELANMKPCEWCRNYKPGRINCATDCICKIPALERREQELLTRQRSRWLPVCQYCKGWARQRDCEKCQQSGHAGDMHRGFLRSVEVPTLECVLTIKPNTRFVGPRDWVEPTDFARTLFRGEFATVQAIVAKDREPWDLRRDGPVGHHLGGPYIWIHPTDGLHPESETGPSVVPDAVFRAAILRNGNRNGWLTVDAAKQALATTLCDTLRALCEGET